MEPLLSATSIQPLLCRTYNLVHSPTHHNSYHIITSRNHTCIATDCECLEASSLSSLPATSSAVSRATPHMSSSLTSGSSRFRTTSQHEPMRKPPQGAKTAVWTAGRTGWLIKHAWANVCHKTKRQKNSFQSPTISAELYLTLKSRLNTDWSENALSLSPISQQRDTDLLILYSGCFAVSCCRRSLIHITG